MKPYISFVIVGRNDDYGGNLVNRISTMTKVLGYHAQRVQKSFELILVEYNPVQQKELLAESLAQFKNEYLAIKVIVVPEAFHKTRTERKIPMLEYVAKNIGVRRASADFILVTNPDIIFSSELIDRICKNPLSQDTFYRVHRRDIVTRYFDPSLTPEYILSTAKKNVMKIFYNTQTLYFSYKEWFWRIIHGRTKSSFKYAPFLNRFRGVEKRLDTVHENAAGDFLLMHKSLWEKINGYDEVPLSSFIDSYILYDLIALGFKQQVFDEPIYHITHNIGKGGRQEVAKQKYLADIKHTIETKTPHKVNGGFWGARDEQFTIRSL